MLNKLGLIKAISLGATITEACGCKVVDLGLKHHFFCGIMEPPKRSTNQELVRDAAFKILKRPFTWTSMRPLEGAKWSSAFPGMELSLTQLQEPAMPEVSFQWLPSQDLTLWAEVVTPIFGFNEEDAKHFTALYEGKENFFHLVAKVHNTVIGTGALHIYRKVAILHNVTTIPKERGKGVGSRITFELLSLAKEKGCSRSLIHASPRAEPMYARLGYVTRNIFWANLFDQRKNP